MFLEWDTDKMITGSGMGNSSADMRLSRLGWDLGKLVLKGKLKSPQDVSNWIRTYIRDR
jgi:hypothetical protein